MRKKLRDVIEPEGEVLWGELAKAWEDGKLRTEEEVVVILRQAYAGCESKQTHDARQLIARAADLLGNNMVVAEAALEGAYQRGKAEVYAAFSAHADQLLKRRAGNSDMEDNRGYDLCNDITVVRHALDGG